MFGLGAAELAGLLVLLLACEWLVYWATLAVTDAPAQGPLRTTLGAFVVTAVLAPLLYGLYYGVFVLFGAEGTPLGDSATLRWTVFAALSVLAAGLLPVLIYLPLLPSRVGKSVQVSVVRLLLSLFLYSLITGIVFVVLAVLQIVRRESTAEVGPGPDRGAPVAVARQR